MPSVLSVYIRALCCVLCAVQVYQDSFVVADDVSFGSGTLLALTLQNGQVKRKNTKKCQIRLFSPPVNQNMPGDGQPSSSQPVKASRKIVPCLRGKKTIGFLGGAPYYYHIALFLCELDLRAR